VPPILTELTSEHRPAVRVQRYLNRMKMRNETERRRRFFGGESPARPPGWLAAYAEGVPGGWVLETAEPGQDGRSATSEDVRGAWGVATDGRFTGAFRPNPHYRPPGATGPVPPAGPSGVLLLFPEAAREDVDFAVRKFGSPALVAGVLFSDRLTRRTYDELADVMSLLGMGPFDENWDPTPEMLWFEGIAYFVFDHLRDHVVAEPE